jgi:hypothetical protein
VHVSSFKVERARGGEYGRVREITAEHQIRFPFYLRWDPQCYWEMDYNRVWVQVRRRIPAWISSRKAQRLLLRILLVITLVPLFLQVLVAYIVGSDARLLPPALLRAKNLLIITAHPDDECLFFSPIILGVLDRNRDIKGGLLVFSTGQ